MMGWDSKRFNDCLLYLNHITKVCLTSLVINNQQVVAGRGSSSGFWIDGDEKRCTIMNDYYLNESSKEIIIKNGTIVSSKCGSTGWEKKENNTLT